MDREKIDKLISKAGLDEIVSVFMSAIEINIHLTKDLPLPGEDDGYRVLAKFADEILRSQWIDVNDRLPEVNKVVDMVLVDFNSFEGDQDGIDKAYGVFWDGESWYLSPGVLVFGKVLGWINVELPEEADGCNNA